MVSRGTLGQRRPHRCQSKQGVSDMKKREVMKWVALLSIAGLAMPASAAPVTFSGIANALASPFVDPSCAPLPFRGIIPPSDGSGTSTLGAFTYSHNVCTAGGPAGGPLQGTFQLDFGGALLSGLLVGTSTPRAGTPGLLDQAFSYSITSGTGFLAAATGGFTNTGTVDSRGGLPSRLTLSLLGTIDIANVPEPSTAAMLMLGLAIVVVGRWSPGLAKTPRP
jgi:hypothetical protein